MQSSVSEGDRPMEFLAEIDHLDGTGSWYMPAGAFGTVVVGYSQSFCLAGGHVEVDFDLRGKFVGIQMFGFGIRDRGQLKLGRA